jgi:hypothetical protein
LKKSKKKDYYFKPISVQLFQFDRLLGVDEPSFLPRPRQAGLHSCRRHGMCARSARARAACSRRVLAPCARAACIEMNQVFRDHEVDEQIQIKQWARTFTKF